MSNNLGAFIKTEQQFVAVDIGASDCWGVDATKGWVKMSLYDLFMAVITAGAWDAADKITTLKLQQATSAAGAGIKDVDDKAITVTATVATNTFTLECKSDELDTNNDFAYVRVLVAATGNTGPDLVSGYYLRNRARYKQGDINSATQSVT